MMLAFVEGTMERLFLNNNFSYVHVVKVENGESWTTDRLAEQIASKYYVLDPNPDLTIVWLDREDEGRNIANMKSKIRDALVSKGADPTKICICVPDLMTENIILADEEVIRQTFGLEDYAYEFEGENGKARLKSLYANIGGSYGETAEGVALLKKIRLSRAAVNSASAKEFADCFPSECWWIG